MTKNRISRTIGGMALGCSLAIASTGNAQTRVLTIPMDGNAHAGKVVMPLVQTAPQHLGSGPIDMNNLPQDVLECDVCRQRLGLPPLKSLSSSLLPQPKAMPQQQNVPQPTGPSLTVPPQAGTVRMLGSPGMMSSKVAEQMAQQGYVVEEFKPPQPAQDAIQLGNIPPEARQQFMQSLNLPQGAKIMSAEVKGAEVKGLEKIAPQIEEVTSKSEKAALDAPPAVRKTESELIPQPKPASQQPTRDAVLEPTRDAILEPTPQVDNAAKEQQLLQTIDGLQKKLDEQAMEQTKLNTLLERLQAESQKQMERADAANREALTMLEKRTAEVTELQLKLKSQHEAMEAMELRSKEADEKHREPSKSDSKKKDSNKSKGKKPEKPSSSNV